MAETAAKDQAQPANVNRYDSLSYRFYVFTPNIISCIIKSHA